MMESVITEGSAVRGLGFPFHHLTTKQNRPTTGTKVNEVRAAPLTFYWRKLNLIYSCTNEDFSTALNKDRIEAVIPFPLWFWRTSSYRD